MHPPDDAWCLAHGQVLAGPDADALAAFCRVPGLVAEVRESAHATGGRYVRVTGAGEARGRLEQAGTGEWILGAEAPESTALDALCAALSAALAAQDLRHRIEIGDANDVIVRAFRHRWAQG